MGKVFVAIPDGLSLSLGTYMDLLQGVLQPITGKLWHIHPYSQQK